MHPEFTPCATVVSNADKLVSPRGARCYFESVEGTVVWVVDDPSMCLARDQAVDQADELLSADGSDNWWKAKLLVVGPAVAQLKDHPRIQREPHNVRGCIAYWRTARRPPADRLIRSKDGERATCDQSPLHIVGQTVIKLTQGELDTLLNHHRVWCHQLGTTRAEHLSPECVNVDRSRRSTVSTKPGSNSVVGDRLPEIDPHLLGGSRIVILAPTMSTDGLERNVVDQVVPVLFREVSPAGAEQLVHRRGRCVFELTQVMLDHFWVVIDAISLAGEHLGLNPVEADLSARIPHCAGNHAARSVAIDQRKLLAPVGEVPQIELRNKMMTSAHTSMMPRTTSQPPSGMPESFTSSTQRVREPYARKLTQDSAHEFERISSSFLVLT